MSEHKSFSKIEQDVRHTFRNNLNTADSTEDVKKFFVYAVQDVIEQVFQGKLEITFDDIWLDQDTEAGFVINKTLKSNPEFHQLTENSDILQIIARMAEKANAHIIHLEQKHPDKTEAKMYPTASHAGRFFKKTPSGKKH